MSNREAKLQARQWVESPGILAEDLRRRLSWIEERAFEPAEVNAIPDVTDSPTIERVISAGNAMEVLNAIVPDDRALWEYRRMLPETRIKFEMFQSLIESLRLALDSTAAVKFSGMPDLDAAVTAVERWAKKQSHKTAEIPLRSDLLRTTIEEQGDELIVRTDENGSIKLRGSVNIPMFLAFWRAPKHRLSMDAFLEIDPGSKHTYLERHRARLCAQLQDILLELIVEGKGVQLQRCRK